MEAIMNTSTEFLITGLPVEGFVEYFAMADAELSARGARRYIADAKPGFPCRVSLVDADPGEEVILLPFPHHAVSTPYQSSGPIFVRAKAQQAKLGVNELPEVVKHRLMSVRAYDVDGWMLESDVVEGRDLARRIEMFFAKDRIRYLHLHNARPGCYSCRADRV